MFTKLRTRAVRLLLPLAVGCSVVVLGQTPSEATTLSGLHVESVTHTSFTVALDSMGSGWEYRLFASTYKPDVFYDHMSSAPYQTALSAAPRLTLSNLPYRTTVYWWRVQAVRGDSHRTDTIRALGLRPNTPTGLAAGIAHGSVSLTWNGGASAGYQVQQATDPDFTVGTHMYTTRALGHQFTPFGLSPTDLRSFRVRASNYGTKSGWTSPVQMTPTKTGQQARVGTFNIRRGSIHGVTWKERRKAVAASIKRGHPQILGIEEGSAWVNGRCSKRQVDDLVARLGAPWKLAKTELVPCKDRGWRRTGVYIIYDSSVYRPLRSGGHWDISDGSSYSRHYGVYHAFENRRSGARLLFVAAHLAVGNTYARDKERRGETENLISRANGLRLNLPIVYVGDFNSHERHRLDGPSVAMRAAHVADARFVAQHYVHPRYNSANPGYTRRPPHSRLSIDHIFGAPGVALRTWVLVMKLRDGKYVGVIPSDHNLLVSDITYPG